VRPTRPAEADDHRPQIKICGLTRPDEAEACAQAGADAIGYIFYPPSPRSIMADAAGRITRVLPDAVCPVGIFVDESYETIMPVAETAGLCAVQLHGRETPALVARLAARGLAVIKALFVNGAPGLGDAPRYTAAAAYLLECVGGPLPGGNALSWDWSVAQTLETEQPIVLAGGLAPENVAEAIADAHPDAVDVSSGVETTPGRKDLARVRALCRTVGQTRLPRPARTVFNSHASLRRA
jgi:phosphoribosylanthranilate isomerase